MQRERCAHTSRCPASSNPALMHRNMTAQAIKAAAMHPSQSPCHRGSMNSAVSVVMPAPCMLLLLSSANTLRGNCVTSL